MVYKMQDLILAMIMQWKKIIDPHHSQWKKESVLDKYINDITVDQVRSEDEGWNKIQDKPLLWIR